MNRKKRRLDPRVRRTRKMLQNAMEALLSEKAYDDILVQEITDRADLDRTTFYLHFRDKQELLIYTVEAIFSEMMIDIPSISSLSDDLKVEDPPLWLIRLFKSIAIRKDFFKSALSDKGVAILFNHIFEFMAAQIANRIGQMNKDPQATMVPESFAVNYMAGAYLGVILWWINKDLPCSPKDAAYNLVQIIIHGFHTSLGIDVPTF